MMVSGGDQEPEARPESPAAAEEMSCERAVNELVHGFIELMQSLPPQVFDPERTRALLCQEEAPQMSCEHFGMTEEQCLEMDARLTGLVKSVADACHVVIPEGMHLPGHPSPPEQSPAP